MYLPRYPSLENDDRLRRRRLVPRFRMRIQDSEQLNRCRSVRLAVILHSSLENNL